MKHFFRNSVNINKKYIISTEKISPRGLTILSSLYTSKVLEKSSENAEEKPQEFLLSPLEFGFVESFPLALVDGAWTLNHSVFGLFAAA